MVPVFRTRFETWTLTVFLADDELAGDLGVGAAGDDMGQDLLLTVR